MVDYVIKSNKEKELYQKEKIIRVLKKLNVSQENIDRILDKINRELPSVVSTQRLFQFIFNLLKSEIPVFSYKYNLKQAIFKLGPAGYPFEKFFAHLLKLYGYKVEHNLFLKGKCLVYEIDFLAEKDNIFYLGECKFHQVRGKVNDSKVVLYSYARFLDIKEAENRQIKPLIVTNTRFTSEAAKYARCYEIKLISWDWPEENLSHLIDKQKVYPLTIFDFLPLKALQNFFNYDIVLIQDVLAKDKSYLKKISGLSDSEIEKLCYNIKNILEFN